MNYLLFGLFFLTSLCGISQVEWISIPSIEGELGRNKAPGGWTITEGSPDMFANSTYPEGFYTLGSLDGFPILGLSAVFIYGHGDEYREGFETNLEGLIVGQEYQFALQWQQVSLINKEFNINIHSGGLLVLIQGDSLKFETDEGVEDGWHIARVKFTAKSTSVKLELKYYASSGYFNQDHKSGAIVVDDINPAYLQAGM